MSYSAAAIANAFIARAQEGRLDGLTAMKLQKLMFYAQSWYLHLNNGQPLFDDFFARWKFGPVIPSIYHKTKHYAAGEVTQKICNLVRK